MNASRPHPFELLFGGFRSTGFPAVRVELDQRADLDTFLLAASALALMGQLRPEEGLGEAVDDFVALVHAAYLFWRDGESTVQLDELETRALCRSAAAPPPRQAARSSRADVGESAPVPSGLIERYIQIAPHLIWGRLDENAAFEPLDGWFAVTTAMGLSVVACFGVHAERPGVSVVTVTGPHPAGIVRADGTPLFAPTMPGGNAAGLYAISAPEELLLLAWRAFAGEDLS